MLRRFRSRGDCAGEVQVQRYRNSDVLQRCMCRCRCRCRVAEVVQRWCRGGAEVQIWRCAEEPWFSRGLKVQRFRGGHTILQSRCRGAGGSSLGWQWHFIAPFEACGSRAWMQGIKSRGSVERWH